MSAQRRSSSPLSSASPSPLQAPTGADETAPLTALNLGAAAAAQAADEEGNIIGGSSPTTLTEPLTESELTEDEDDDMDEDHKVDAPPLEAPADDADEPLSDIGDEDGVDGADVKPTTSADNRRSPEGSPLSPSPSLTPPPPSDPPHSQALPSSPHAPIDGAEDITVVKQHGDDSLLDDDDDGEAAGSTAKVAGPIDADSGDEALTPEPPEDEDGDVTMRAEDDTAGHATAHNEDATEPNGSPVKQDGVDGDVEIDEREENPDAEVQVEVSAPDEGEAEEEGEGEAEAEAEEEADETDAQDTAAAQSRAAMRALFALEVKFAALRDRLYVERLEEAAREEEMVLNGTHPALMQLNKTLQSRRERLHEVASRRHYETINDLGNWRKIEEKISWSTWTDQRDQLHWEEFEHTWSKRRRLAREKNELETPKTYRPVPRVDKPPKPFDWSAGAVPPRLSTEDALRDLRAMNTRRTQPPPPQQPQHPSRHQSPMYGGAYAGPSTSMYPYQTAQHPASYLQADNSQLDRRHQDMQAAQQAAHPRPQQQQQQQQPPPPQQQQNQHQAHRQPVASQHMAQSHAHPPEVQNQASRMAASSVAGPARPPASQRKVETYAMPPRRDLPAQPNGDGRLNGHAAHRQGPRPLAAAAAASNPGHPAVSNAPDTKPGLALSTAGASGQAAAQQQADRPQHRFPGFTDYLSRESAAGHPPNSFQHHLNPTAAKPSSGQSPVPNSSTTTSGASSSLVRQAFAQPAPQVQQTAGAQRS